MTDIMEEIYYLLVERVGQQYANDINREILVRRRCALQDEIGLRIGEDGEELLDRLADLDADIETIHDKAMFREALRLGAEIVRAGSSPRGERCTHTGAGPRTAEHHNNRR